jgi:ferrochelatase
VTAGGGTTGVVVMAYGTPAGVDQVEGYYTHIRRGRPPEPQQLADLIARYEAIGGTSPLARRTEAQRAAIADALDARAPGAFEVVLGNKHAPPFIEDAVGALADRGVDQVLGLVLAPHHSKASVGEYQRRAAGAAAERGLDHVGIDSWHLLPAYLDFLTGAVTEARATVPERHKVLFTAHSLPERALVGDAYPEQLRASATAVADRLGLAPWAGWGLCWQSAGRTPEPWRGPDVLTVLRELGGTGRADGVVVCAQGFVADHLEVLYDLDVEAAAVAEGVGLAFARTRSLNADPTVMAALADLVAERAGVAGS